MGEVFINPEDKHFITKEEAIELMALLAIEGADDE